MIIASSEFALKSAPVRRTLEQRLLDDIRTALSRAGINGLKPEKHAGRIVIRGAQDPQTVARACSRIFGVAYATHGLVVPASLDEITQTVVQVASEGLGNGQTFAIRAHRSGPSEVSRREVEVRGGAEVLAQLKQRGVTVKLNRPDVTVYVDLADDRAYVYADKTPGPGGLPLSSQWKMLAIVDSGPLSILAAYAMMRRGCMVELFIPVSARIGLFNREYQLDLASRLRRLVTRADYKAYVFEVDGALGTVFDQSEVRRRVREVALGFARKKKFRGIVLPDVEGDLQAIRSDVAGEAVPPVPLYPLIGFDREDLVQLSAEVGISVEEFRRASEEETKPVPVEKLSPLTNDLGEYVKQVLL